VKLLPYGSQPSMDTRPDFVRWWQSLPPDWREARLDARREWIKACPRPNAAFEQRCIEAVAAHSRTEKWRLGYRTTPAKWIRGGRWDDYVEPAPAARQEWVCPHVPPCHMQAWCTSGTRDERDRQRAERGEA